MKKLENKPFINMEKLEFYYVIKRFESFNSEVFKNTLSLIEKDLLTFTFEGVLLKEIYVLYISSPGFEKEVKVETGCVEEVFKKLLSENIELFSLPSQFYNNETQQAELLIRIQFFNKSDLNFYNKLTDKEKIDDFLNSFKSNASLNLTDENSDLNDMDSYISRNGRIYITDHLRLVKIKDLTTFNVINSFNHRKFINTINNVIESLKVNDRLHFFSNINIHVVGFEICPIFVERENVNYKVYSIFDKDIDIIENMDIKNFYQRIFSYFSVLGS
jgi:hypothetical protein